jgi:hypothetical protein
MTDTTNDAWEQIRHLTLDQLVTQTKLRNASSALLNGFTTPEKWPFILVIAIGGPGNELAVDAAKTFHDTLKDRARWSYASANPDPKVRP